MKIGVVVYSQTGNTRSVADKLKDALSAAGHDVELYEVTLAGARAQGSRSFELGPLPNVGARDVLVFGSPVEAFALSPVMVRALQGWESLAGTRVAGLITQGLRYRWLGGHRALRQMGTLCESKGATVLGGEIVNWAGPELEARIEGAVTSLVRLIGA